MNGGREILFIPAAHPVEAAPAGVGRRIDQPIGRTFIAGVAQ
jgi:hypothetical protein